MGTEWIETTVGDFCPFHYGKGLPERNRIPGPYPVFGSNGQVGSHYQPFVNEPGIIIGRKGTVGAVHFSKLPFCPIDTTFYVVSADYRDLRFTYYLLKSLGLDRMNADSAVPGLNREAAHKRKILVPPLSTQRAIAHILGTLDDKIELNRRMNETLEAVAQALFKSWFVDFDPVVVNAIKAGTPLPEKFAKRAAHYRENPDALGLPEHILRLFPDRFQESELGPIPKGWEVVRFNKIAYAKQGKYLSKRKISDRVTGEYVYPVWGGNGIRGYTNEKLYEEQVVALTCRGSNCGRVDTTKSPAWISNIAFACLPRYGSVNFLYIYFKHISFKSCITGSAQPQITFANLRNKLMEHPIAPNIIELFSRLVEPLFREIVLRNQEKNTIDILRNTLLPKLISAELRVPDVEKILEDVL